MIGVRPQTGTARRNTPAGSLAVGLGCAGVAAQICYPLVGESLRDLITVAVVTLLAGACVAHALASRGRRWAAGLVVITVGGGLLAEFVGTATDFPFGGYTYTTAGALGPELGPIPLLIGPAWTFGTYPAWCAAQAVLRSRRGAMTVPVAAWGLTSWDLYLDPQMVADGRWLWHHPDPVLPGVAGVPLSNYLGWLLVALLLCGALYRLDRALGTAPPERDGLPLALFCWTWLGGAVAHAALLGLPASAGYGFVGMGLIGVPLLAVLPRKPTARPLAEPKTTPTTTPTTTR